MNSFVDQYQVTKSSVFTKFKRRSIFVAFHRIKKKPKLTFHSFKCIARFADSGYKQNFYWFVERNRTHKKESISGNRMRIIGKNKYLIYSSIRAQYILHYYELKSASAVITHVVAFFWRIFSFTSLFASSHMVATDDTCLQST